MRGMIWRKCFGDRFLVSCGVLNPSSASKLGSSGVHLVMESGVSSRTECGPRSHRWECRIQSVGIWLTNREADRVTNQERGAGREKRAYRPAAAFHSYRGFVVMP